MHPVVKMFLRNHFDLDALCANMNDRYVGDRMDLHDECDSMIFREICRRDNHHVYVQSDKLYDLCCDESRTSDAIRTIEWLENHQDLSDRMVE